MATSKYHHAPPSHRYFAGDQNKSAGQELELDEWDIYNNGPTGSVPAGRFSFSNPGTTIFGPTGDDRNRSRSGRPSQENLLGTAPASLPVNVPDWSKILREENRGSRRWYDDVVGGENDAEDASGDGGRRIPPHEFLARRRMASFSVHEGAGRTLKGRDLSRVRNAVFEITGFQD